MAKNKELNLFERRMTIIILICRKKHIIVDELASRFNVSSRTIRKDISDISKFFKLKSVSGRYDGGIKLNDDSFFKINLLSEEEIDCLKRVKKRVCEEEMSMFEGIIRKMDVCR